MKLGFGLSLVGQRAAGGGAIPSNAIFDRAGNSVRDRAGNIITTRAA